MFGLSKISDLIGSQLSNILSEHGLGQLAAKLDLSSLKEVEALLGKLAEEGAIDGAALATDLADALSETSGSIFEIAGEVLEGANVEEAADLITAEPIEDGIDAVPVQTDQAAADVEPSAQIPPADQGETDSD